MRPLWLCYELNIPVAIEPADATKNYRSSDAFRAISPAGKVPALTDGDLAIVESGAIVEFLLDRYGNGRLRPEGGTQESATYKQWCWFSEATLIRPVGLYRLLRAKDEDAQTLVTDAKNKFHEAMLSVEHALQHQPYLLGDEFSAADIMLGYSLAITQRLLGTRFTPHAQEYLQRLQKRPACIKAFNS